MASKRPIGGTGYSACNNQQVLARNSKITQENTRGRNATMILRHEELGAHTATFDTETKRLAITGESGSILLSTEETWKLLDMLYDLRGVLFRATHADSWVEEESEGKE